MQRGHVSLRVLFYAFGFALMIGRTGFAGDLLYGFAVSGFIYPIIGPWGWGRDVFLHPGG